MASNHDIHNLSPEAATGSVPWEKMFLEIWNTSETPVPESLFQ